MTRADQERIAKAMGRKTRSMSGLHYKESVAGPFPQWSEDDGDSWQALPLDEDPRWLWPVLAFCIKNGWGFEPLGDGETLLVSHQGAAVWTYPIQDISEAVNAAAALAHYEAQSVAAIPS